MSRAIAGINVRYANLSVMPGIGETLFHFRPGMLARTRRLVRDRHAEVAREHGAGAKAVDRKAQPLAYQRDEEPADGRTKDAREIEHH
jgi:hypothetical protein